MKIKLFLALLFPFLLLAQTPTYYQSIDFTQTGQDLNEQLTTLLDFTHAYKLPYTSSSLDTWYVIKRSDLLYESSNDVLLIYGYDDEDDLTINDRTRSIDLSCYSNSCTGLWNREHVFPRSLANPNLDVSYPSAGTDVHNLRRTELKTKQILR